MTFPFDPEFTVVKFKTSDFAIKFPTMPTDLRLEDSDDPVTYLIKNDKLRWHTNVAGVWYFTAINNQVAIEAVELSPEKTTFSIRGKNVWLDFTWNRITSPEKMPDFEQCINAIESCQNVIDHLMGANSAAIDALNHLIPESYELKLGISKLHCHNEKEFEGLGIILWAELWDIERNKNLKVWELGLPSRLPKIHELGALVIKNESSLLKKKQYEGQLNQLDTIVREFKTKTSSKIEFDFCEDGGEIEILIDLLGIETAIKLAEVIKRSLLAIEAQNEKEEKEY